MGIMLQGILHAQTITLESEAATLTGVSVAKSHVGYSGTGYVVMGATGSMQFRVTLAQNGVYQMNVRASTPMGAKNQKLLLNGVYISPLVYPANPAWFDASAGSLALKAGDNWIKIEADWGYMEFDRISLTKVPNHDYSQVVVQPVDLYANLATKQLYTTLRSHYGTNIISGQTSYWDELVTIARRTPVIRGFDMQNYSPHNPWGVNWKSWDDGMVKSAIDWYNSTGKKGIVTFQWHWFSPLGGVLKTSTFNKAETSFDITKAVQPGTAEYLATLRDIDSIAVQLKRLQAAGVPVLWRPLHEAGGGWFWWGAKGPAPAKALYNIMYDRLTGYHGLHNLIWVWASPEPEWYPGNTKVDIIAYDSYPGPYVYSSQKSTFDKLFEIVGGKKLVAMSENGPIPDIATCIAEDAMWSYFATWVDFASKENSASHVQYTYAHSRVISLDEFNLLSSSKLQSSSIKASSSSAVAPSSSSTTSGLCGNPVLISNSGTYNISANGACFKIDARTFRLGTMLSVRNNGAYYERIEWTGGLDQNVTSCKQTISTLSGNGAQLNNFAAGKDASGYSWLKVIPTNGSAVSIYLDRQNWQNGSGCTGAVVPPSAPPPRIAGSAEGTTAIGHNPTNPTLSLPELLLDRDLLGRTRND
jgi:mannan endo-1,4-beta-mannosidase